MSLGSSFALLAYAGVGLVPATELIWQVLPSITSAASLGLIWIISLACPCFSYMSHQEA